MNLVLAIRRAALAVVMPCALVTSAKAEPPAGALTVLPTVEPAFDVYARPGRLVRLSDGRRLNLRCAGTGPVTIVLESGLGFPSYSWRKVQPRLSRLARTCSYDRTGLGFSDAGPLPRTAGRIADDLARLLSDAGERPPYLLVANSFGSQPARLFAFRHPDRVAGLLLLDPYVEGQNEALRGVEGGPPDRDARERAAERTCLRLLLARRLSAAAAAKRGCIDDPDPAFSPKLAAVTQRQRMGAAMARAAASEAAELEVGSARELRAERRELGDLPLLVLTAGADFAGEAKEAELLSELRQLHRTLAALSTRGEERLVPGAGHVIQSSAPDAVVAAVGEVLAQAERR